MYIYSEKKSHTTSITQLIKTLSGLTASFYL